MPLNTSAAWSSVSYKLFLSYFISTLCVPFLIWLWHLKCSDSVPQFSQRGHLRYSKLLLILHYVAKINPLRKTRGHVDLFVLKKISLWRLISCCSNKVYTLKYAKESDLYISNVVLSEDDGLCLIYFAFTENDILSCKDGDQQPTVARIKCWQLSFCKSHSNLYVSYISYWQYASYHIDNTWIWADLHVDKWREWRDGGDASGQPSQRPLFKTMLQRL